MSISAGSEYKSAVSYLGCGTAVKQPELAMYGRHTAVGSTLKLNSQPALLQSYIPVYTCLLHPCEVV